MFDTFHRNVADPLCIHRGPPGVHGPQFENRWSRIRFCKGAGAFCSKRKVGPFFRKRFIDKDNAYLLEKSLNADVGYRVFSSVSQSPNNLFRKIQRFYMPPVRFYRFWGRSVVKIVQFDLRP